MSLMACALKWPDLVLFKHLKSNIDTTEYDCSSSVA